MKNSCEGCKRYWNHLHGKVTRFVRRMSKSSRHCMVIPERFANHFAGKMSRAVKLEGPNGILYDVGVTEHRNRKVLQSGWEVFVDANDIVEKDSLMFRYRGSSRFKVAVFDSNGCEKTVSCFGIGSTMSDQEPITNSTEMRSSSSDRNTHSSMGWRSDGCQSESSGHCRELARTDATSSPSEDLSGEDSPYEQESSGSDDHTLPKPLYVLAGQCCVTEEQEANIVALVQEIQPQMPLLVARMKKPNVKPYPDLVIPKDYAMTYFPHKSQTITLQLARQSKEWHCKYHVIPDGGRCNLYWYYFVLDNHFLEGDLCLLQPMANGEGTTFAVIIHVLRKSSIDHSSAQRPVSSSDHCSPSTMMISTVRVKEEQYSDASGRSDGCPSGSSSYSGNTRKTAVISTPSAESGPPKDKYVLSSRSNLTEAQKEKIDMLLQDIQSKTLAFVAIMRKSNVQPLYPSLTITKDYAVAHFPHESASVILQRPGENKRWYPRFYEGNDGIHKIRGEWLDFVCDNSVEEGDICIFVPAKGGGRFTFTVHLLRAESQAYAGPFVPPYILSQMSSLTPLQQSIVEDKAEAIQLEAHLYVAIMNKTSVGVKGHYILEFGAKYAAVYLPKEEQTILLQRNGKEWQTQMRIRNGRRCVLEGGWSKFVRDNHLRVGDMCMFELKKNRKKLSMIVHIISSDQC